MGTEGGVVSGEGPNGGRESPTVSVDIILILDKVYQKQDELVFQRNNHNTSYPTWRMHLDNLSHLLTQQCFAEGTPY